MASQKDITEIKIGIMGIKKDISQVNKHLGRLNGSVASHESRLDNHQKVLWVVFGMIIMASFVFGKEGVLNVLASMM